MEDGKRFYWLRLKEDFFKQHEIKVIEGMDNGKEYVLFYLKLMVESISHKGRLRFADTIPYNERMLASLTDTNIDIVRSAMKVLIELQLCEILDDKTIYLSEVEKLTGYETKWAEYKRNERNHIGQSLDNVQQSIEIRDKRLEIRDKSIENRDDNKHMVIADDRLTSSDTSFDKEFDEVWELYPKKQGKQNALKAYIKARKDGVDKDDIINGINNYIFYIKKMNIEPKYIKQGSTWFNQRCWGDDYTVVEKRTMIDEILNAEPIDLNNPYKGTIWENV